MMMGISGMVGMSGLLVKTKMLTDTKCYTFSEPQAQADFNDDRNLRISGISGMLRMSGETHRHHVSYVF